MDRYWVKEDNGPWREVDMAGFVAAERRAGFHNTMGRPDLPGTGGFSHTYHPGQPDEWSIQGTMTDPAIREALDQLDGSAASAVTLLAGVDPNEYGGTPDE